MLAGLALGLLSVVALSRLAEPGARPSPPDADRPGVPVTGQGGEEPREPAIPTCSLGGTEFVLHPEVEGEAWARVENTGVVPATIEAIELGWSGDVATRQIVVRSGPGGAESVVFEGAASSPLFATLDSMPVLEPGQSIEIGWRVDAAAGEPWTPDVAVLHTQEGCQTALRRIDPIDAACGLSATAPLPIGGLFGTVEFTITNTSGVDTAIHTLEIDWPVGVNGALLTILVDDLPFKTFDSPPDGAPAAIALTRYRRDGIPLPTGGRVRIGLAFERGAAPGPYSVVAGTSAGCTIIATTRATPPDCGATLKDLVFAGDTARVRLHNPRTVDRELRTLDLFWPAGAVGPLVEVMVDGGAIWSGEIATSPASVVPDRRIVVPARGGLTLHFRFRLTGDIGDLSGGVPAGAYTLVAGLDGGCRATLSTVAEPLGCNISAGAIVTDGAEARFSLSNVGMPAALREIGLTWNPANGALTGVGLGETWLFEGAEAASARPLTISIPSGVSPILAGGAPVDLRLRFEADARPDGYSVSLAFGAPDGALCRQVWINLPLSAPDECAYRLTGLSQDGIHVMAELTNAGAEPGSIEWIEFAWPNPDPLRPLVQVALVSGDGSVRSVLWSGRAVEPPARLLVDPGAGADARIAPGETLALRLRFGGLIDPVPDPATAFDLSLGMADGCRIHAVPEDAPPPKSVSLSGVVVGPLPDPLLACCWSIQVRTETGGLERLNVAVDASTVFEPAAIEPRPGDNVTIEALVFADGSIYAERIRFHRASTSVRLVGAVQRISPTLRPATGLPEFIVVLGRTVSLLDATIVEGKLVVGAQATVEGETRADGNVTATFIAVARDRIGELVEVRGIVQSAVEVGSPGVGCRPQVWHLGAYRIDVPPDALPAGGAGDPCPVPERGDRYRVEGRLMSEGEASIGAPIDVIEAQASFPEALPASVDLEGRIVGLPPAGLLGTWTIETASGRVDFEVRSLAVVDARIAPAELGMHATVKVDPRPDGAVALRVRIDWGDG